MVRMSYHLGAFRDAPQYVDGAPLAVLLENQDAAWALRIVRIADCLSALPCYPVQATSLMCDDRDLPVTRRVALGRLRGFGLTTIWTSRSSAFR